MTHNPFDRAGLASVDDLSTPHWRSCFSHLESIQIEFLDAQPHHPDYPWPRDPLHNCIRVWEYPFVYHHLQFQGGSLPSQTLPQAVDLGSAATFFPFAVARLGWRVIAVDADSRATSSVDRAIGRVSAGSGAVTSLLSDARSIALETESVDCVYCVSVLEHVPDFEKVISEIRRILRPAGLLVLTFDVGLRAGWELGPVSYARLSNALEGSFSAVFPARVIHPLRVLTTDNSIFPRSPRRFIFDPLITPLRHSLHYAYNRLRGRQYPRSRALASTYGACLRKH
ncbi:MAG: class I SAM-dependent methyltransferase [Bryobacteraceae bacterium]